MKNLVKIFTVIYFFSGQSSNGAVDPVFESLNLLTTQKLGSKFKRERDLALLLPPPLPHHQIGFIGTDTDALVKAVDDGNINDFVKILKTKVVIAVNAWLDAILPAEGDFLFGSIAKVANAPINNSKASFKEALLKVVDDAVVLTPAPINKSLKSLSETAIAANTEISNIVVDWAKSLLSGLDLQYLALPVQSDGAKLAGLESYAPRSSKRSDFLAAMYIALSYAS
jgi:hypothetical protein